LMEYMIQRGVPQRTAHGVVGGLVRRALASGVPLSALSLEDFKAADPSLDSHVYDVLGVDRALAAFASYGSTGPEQVADQLLSWKQKLAATASR